MTPVLSVGFDQTSGRRKNSPKTEMSPTELSIGFGEERRGEAVVTLTTMVDARGKLRGSLNGKDV